MKGNWNMILADKIIALRKKNGLSQEELAEKMSVSRQSVSKWEGAQSVPDLNKIIMLSEIFNVSTDYLLKDDIAEAELLETPAAVDSGEDLRQVSMEEANEFLDSNRRYAGKLAVGTLLCILSVIPMIFFGVLSELAENDLLAGLGVVLMLAVIAPAVALFIRCGRLTEKYKYLDTQAIDTAYGVDGMVKERLERFKPVFDRSLIIGVVLCILGAAAMILTGTLADSPDSGFKGNTDLLEALGVCAMLALIAVGVFIIVRASTVKGGFDRLLEEGDYSRINKEYSKNGVNVVMIYWLVIVGIFLGISFGFNTWKYSWIVFVVGGVLSPVVSELSKLGKRKNK